jgi:hypothetical protein
VQQGVPKCSSNHLLLNAMPIAPACGRQAKRLAYFLSKYYDDKQNGPKGQSYFKNEINWNLLKFG